MERRSVVVVILAAFLTSLPPGAHAAEIHVTPDSPGIQAAIESAADGDEIIVAQGVYQEHINFLGKAITLRSTDPDDPDVVAATIIDGTDTGRCVTFDSDEGPDSVLTGLTITNGNAQGEDYERYGGGVFCHMSSPTIVGNLIIGNTAETDGGGICAYWCSPVITGNTISGNEAFHGGGIYSWPSGNVNRFGGQDIIGNLITGNTASLRGGGIYTRTGFPILVSGNTIAANSALQGAGLLCSDGDVILAENTIISNVSDGWGGGIVLVTLDAVLTNNLVADNRAVSTGGGICILRCNVFMMGDVIAGNASYPLGIGGGMYISSSSAFISNAVITQNYARKGPAMLCTCSLTESYPITIFNSIMWGNYETRWVPFELKSTLERPLTQTDNDTTLRQNDVVPQAMIGGIRLSVYNSIISSVPGPIYIDPFFDRVVGNARNVNADPMFVDPGHWDDNGTPDNVFDDFFVMGDYHLLPGSPCIDRGINNIDNLFTEAIEELPETDFDGMPRIVNGDINPLAVVDMGAYEYRPGDVNYDGKLNVLDLLLIRNNMGLDPSSYPAARKADVTADGKVDITDLIAARNLFSAW